MAIRVSRKLIITVSVAAVVILGGGAAYAIANGYLTLPGKTTTAGTGTDANTSTNGGSTSTTSAADTKFTTQVQTQVNTLVAAGDPTSIKQAGQILDTQVAVASKSGDDDYIVDTNLAKADLLLNTDQPQAALDTILLPLNQQYGNNDTYKYRIDSYLGQAYNALGNTDKANGYYNLIPPVEDN